MAKRREIRNSTAERNHGDSPDSRKQQNKELKRFNDKWLKISAILEL